MGSIDTADEQLTELSSLGPTFDGRVKPDLVAPGAHTSRGSYQGIVAAKSTNTYVGRSGTSQAAPVVTGAIALLMQTVEEVGIAQRSLHASTFKAVLIHTARDLVAPPSGLAIANPDTFPHPVTYGVGPDYATGYGLVDAQAACSVIAEPARWIEGSLTAAGEERVFCFDVPPGATEVKATLVWDDWPGSTAVCDTCPTLVHDLDLALIDPTGQEHLPWIVDLAPPSTTGGPDPIGASVPAATRGVDHRNNVEMVSPTAFPPGRWKARVRAHSLPLGRSQPYSLVLSPAMTFCFSRFPPTFDLCQVIEWLCDRDPLSQPDFDPVPRVWKWESRSLLPLSELRRIEGQPALHDGYAWLAGPGFDIVVTPLADGAVLVLLDQNGTIVARGRAEGGLGRVRAESAPAEAQLFLLLTDADLQPFAAPAALSIRVVMLE